MDHDAETTSWDIAAWLAAVQPEFGQNQTTVIPLAGSDPNRRQSRLNLQRNAIFDQTWPGRLPARQSCCRQSCHRQHRPPGSHICLEANSQDRYRRTVSSKRAAPPDLLTPHRWGRTVDQLWPFYYGWLDPSGPLISVVPHQGSSAHGFYHHPTRQQARPACQALEWPPPHWPLTSQPQPD